MADFFYYLRAPKSLLPVLLVVALVFLSGCGGPGVPSSNINDLLPPQDPNGISRPISSDSCPTKLTFVAKCSYNSDRPARDINYTKRFDPAASIIAQGPNASAFAVGVGTNMVIENFSTFTNKLYGGSAGVSAHAVDLFVDGNKVADNGWACVEWPNCFDGNSVCVAKPENKIYYAFMRQGLHRVRIVWDMLNNARCALTGPGHEFDVLVTNPIISVNGSDDQGHLFRKNDTSKTTLVNWTITNTGPDRVLLDSITATGCGGNTGLDCRFVGFPRETFILGTDPLAPNILGTGPVVPSNENSQANPSAAINLSVVQGESIVVPMRVVLSKPGSVPLANVLSVDVKFSDAYNAFRATESAVDSVKLTRVFVEKQQFNVELVAGDQRLCIGRDGRLGATGAAAVPRVLLSWDWADIALDSCSPKHAQDANAPYCDPTQFSIALLKRLDRISTLAKQGNIAGASSLTKFKAFLMQDTINSDFRKDFDYYYTDAGFFNAPAFYEDPETPWSKYFTDQSRMGFSQESVSAGLYDVEISVDSTDGVFSFFGATGPVAVIKVGLEKASNPDIPNPFYLLPVNGGVGLFGVDADGKTERKGYGVKFTGASIPVSPSVSTVSTSGEKTANVESVSDFSVLNITERETVLSLLGNAAELRFAPSYATPVAMAMVEQNVKAEAFYYLLKNNQALPVQGNFASFWTGFGSTPMQCRNFDNSPIYYRENDSKAVAGACVDLSAGFDSFGFRFSNVPAANRNGRVFLETIFYTPVNSVTILKNACAAGNAVFASPTQAPSSGQVIIELKHKSSGASLKEMFEKIAAGDLCASVEQGALEVWWNPQKVAADLNLAKQAMLANSPTPVICTLPPEIVELPS